MENLQLHHYLAAYLPYALNGIEGKSELTLIAVSEQKNDGYWLLTNKKSDFGLWGEGRVKLRLHPLSLYKDINSNEMNKLNWDIADQVELNEFANNEVSVLGLHYATFILCCKNKIDVFGLIEKGLAVPLT